MSLLPYQLIEIHAGSVAIPYVVPMDSVISLNYSRGNVLGTPDELTAGSLTLITKGLANSPMAGNLVLGQTIRVRGLDHTSTWKELWKGTLDIPTMSFNRDGECITTYLGYDAVAAAGRALHKTAQVVQGSLSTQMSNAILSKSGAPPAGLGTSVTDTSGVTRTFSAQTVTGEPYVLEMVERVINNFIGQDRPPTFAWASRADHNVIKVRGTMDNAAAAFTEFSDDDLGTTQTFYTDIAVVWSGEKYAGALTFEHVDGTTNGPYILSTGEGIYSRRPATIRGIRPFSAVDGIGDLIQKAKRFFESQTNAGVQVDNVRFNVLENRNHLTDDRLYQKVAVRHGPSSHLADYLVIREEHDITPKSWFATYDLRPADLQNISNPVLAT